MTKDEAINILSMHLMQCGMMMPIEWVQKNGGDSDFMQAYKMAMDALKNEPVRCKDCKWYRIAPIDNVPLAEYINRECLLDAMQAEREGLRPLYDNYALGFEKGILLVKGFPYADVAQVVHGRWEHMHDFVFNCTHCGNTSEVETCMGKPKWNYCPNCGARMNDD